MNESSSFKCLMRYIKSKPFLHFVMFSSVVKDPILVKEGILFSSKDILKLWDYFRNKLAHVVAPQEGSALITFKFGAEASTVSIETYKKFLKEQVSGGLYAFIKTRDEKGMKHYYGFVDVFLITAEMLVESLTQEIQDGNYDSNLANAWEWMLSN